jgi:hypothetical protein
VPRLASTLLHEMCHAAQFLVDNATKPPHGPAFQRWVKEVERFYPHLMITTCHNYEIKYKCVRARRLDAAAFEVRFLGGRASERASVRAREARRAGLGLLLQPSERSAKRRCCCFCDREETVLLLLQRSLARCCCFCTLRKVAALLPRRLCH